MSNYRRMNRIQAKLRTTEQQAQFEADRAELTQLVKVGSLPQPGVVWALAVGLAVLAGGILAALVASKLF